MNDESILTAVTPVTPEPPAQPEIASELTITPELKVQRTMHPIPRKVSTFPHPSYSVYNVFLDATAEVPKYEERTDAPGEPYSVSIIPLI
jgi:hypothetical protein